VSERPSAESADRASDGRRVAVVYNPTKTGTDELRRAVHAAAKSAGYDEPIWLETTADDPGRGMAAEAVQRGASVVIAAGGDGTVRAAAGGLRGTGVALGIVPAGTGNLLARNLALPLADIEHAVAIALSGAERTIDVGVAELTREDGTSSEDVFLVMAGLGIDAAMFANTSDALKQKLGWLAYVDGGMRSLVKSKRVRINYTVDGRNGHTAHVSTILAGNCGALPGNIELMPDALLDDGELDIAVLQPRSIFGWLMIWRKITWENRVLRRSAFGRQLIKFTGSDKSGMLTYLRGPGVQVTVDDVQPVELDGDEFGHVVGIHMWADPGALVVRVPR
jgi:Sphingosine kinase and enzymes related to eukaryotic diacylglycerol kinase